jgi:hypothetical protein
VFHPSIGWAVVMTSALLLMALPSKLSCPRRHISGIAPSLGFSDNPADPVHAVGTCSTSEAVGEHRIGYFVPEVRFA